MSCRPVDSLSLSWSEPTSAPARSPTSRSRVDPSTHNIAAGARLSAQKEVQLRGIGMVQPQVPQQQAAAGMRSNSITTQGKAHWRSESVKTVLFAPTTEVQANTAVRGVGGNSSLSGILSNPVGVPVQQQQGNAAAGSSVSQRTSGRAHLGINGNRSSIDLSDAGSSNPSSSPVSRRGGLLAHNSRSSSDLVVGNNTMLPLPMTQHRTIAMSGRQNRSQFEIGQMEKPLSEQEKVQLQQQQQKRHGPIHLRSNESSFSHNESITSTANKSGPIHLRSNESSFALGGAGAEVETENSGVSSSNSNKQHRGLVGQSDIFNLSAKSIHTPVKGKAHVIGAAHRETKDEGQSQCSMIPRLGKVAYQQTNAVSHVLGNAPVSSGKTKIVPQHQRTASGNVRNTSSLFFDSPAMQSLQPKPQQVQLPEMPQSMRRHQQLAAQQKMAAVESATKTALIWQ